MEMSFLNAEDDMNDLKQKNQNQKTIRKYNFSGKIVVFHPSSVTGLMIWSITEPQFLHIRQERRGLRADFGLDDMSWIASQ
jgi:hypothetical protein